MTLEERVSALEANLEASKFIISALLGASTNARKVAFLINLLAQQFEENPTSMPSLSSAQRVAILDLLSRYEAQATQFADAESQTGS
jgi:hypothetical protein